MTTTNPRRWELDALRGLMLVLMACTHLPTRFSEPLGQPFGFVSAAEGFVMLSGYMAGLVYTARERRDGGPVMRAAFVRRAAKIYLCQAALLLFLFSIVALLGVAFSQAAVENLMAFYLDQPLPALLGSLLLLYSPPLLDILPMYILFMLISPLLLLHGLRHGWRGVMAASVLLWVGAQFEVGRWLYRQSVELTALRVPYQETGAFHVLAWQFLWVLGLWMGSESVVRPSPPARFPPAMVRTAAVIAAVCFVWRHAIGQSPFGGHEVLNLAFDKWQLAPLRLIDFFALLTLTLHFGPWLKAHLPRLRPLEVLGAASLPVFCAHLVLTLIALSVLGAADAYRPLWIDVAVLGGGLAAMYAVARVSAQMDRQAAKLRRSPKQTEAETPAPKSASAPANADTGR